MTGDQAAGLIWGFGALVLVGSALAARRLPMARLGLMTVVWIAIFAVAISLAIVWQGLRQRAGAPSHRPAAFPYTT